MIVSISSDRLQTRYWHRCSRWLVMSLVPEESPDPKEVAQLLKTTDALSALCHAKPMEHLVPGSVAFPTRSVLLPNESN
jgi:hypothetical protein